MTTSDPRPPPTPCDARSAAEHMARDSSHGDLRFVNCGVSVGRGEGRADFKKASKQGEKQRRTRRRSRKNRMFADEINTADKRIVFVCERVCMKVEKNMSECSLASGASK